MTPVMWAAVAVVIFIVAALAVRNMQSKDGEQKSAALAPVAQLFAHAEPVRLRSQFDVETDEDLAVIEKVYREQRTAERARQALERLAPLVPTAAKK